MKRQQTLFFVVFVWPILAPRMTEGFNDQAPIRLRTGLYNHASGNAGGT
jgi:hypothetical protein